MNQNSKDKGLKKIGKKLKRKRKKYLGRLESVEQRHVDTVISGGGASARKGTPYVKKEKIPPTPKPMGKRGRPVGSKDKVKRKVRLKKEVNKLKKIDKVAKRGRPRGSKNKVKAIDTKTAVGIIRDVKRKLKQDVILGQKYFRKQGAVAIQMFRNIYADVRDDIIAGLVGSDIPEYLQGCNDVNEVIALSVANHMSIQEFSATPERIIAFIDDGLLPMVETFYQRTGASIQHINRDEIIAHLKDFFEQI